MVSADEWLRAPGLFAGIRGHSDAAGKTGKYDIYLTNVRLISDVLVSSLPRFQPPPEAGGEGIKRDHFADTLVARHFRLLGAFSTRALLGG